MDKQSLSCPQSNTNAYFSDILKLTCKIEIQNLCKVFIQWDFTFVASPQLVCQNQAKPDYISLACECMRREWCEKFLPSSAGWQAGHNDISSLFAMWQGTFMLGPDGRSCCLRTWARAYPEHRERRATTHLGSGEAAYSSLSLFAFFFFPLR